MPIRIHGNDPALSGSVKFLNQSVARYFVEQGSNPLTPLKQQLKESMTNDLYLTDLTVLDQKNAKVELVEMRDGKVENCYFLKVSIPSLKFEGSMQKPTRDKMSEASMQMIDDIQQKMEGPAAR